MGLVSGDLGCGELLRDGLKVGVGGSVGFYFEVEAFVRWFGALAVEINAPD